MLNFGILLCNAKWVSLRHFQTNSGASTKRPIVAFLFILGSKILSRLILRAKSGGLLHEVKVARNASAMSHMLFADDLLLFARANQQEATTIKNIMEQYCSRSGQKVNLGKSALFCSENAQPKVVVDLYDFLQVKRMSQQAKYLGLPMFVGRPRKKPLKTSRQRCYRKWRGGK